MPLGKYRRKYSKPSSNDSLSDALYNQLLQSLVQGGEPPATEEQCRRWVHSTTNKSFRLLNESIPWPMRHRQALNLLQMFDRETFSHLHKVMLEVSESNSSVDWLAETERARLSGWSGGTQ